mgnify:CR=1 FL=1
MNIATENKIQNYLIKDKQILKPSHNYSLDEYGLNEKITTLPSGIVILNNSFNKSM